MPSFSLRGNSLHVSGRTLPPTHGFAGKPPRASSCHVVYAIVAERGKTLQLPFFSRVSLRNAAEMIHNLGVSVSYQGIPNHTK